MRVKHFDLDKLMSIPDVELAYIAGFFDGEGCVAVGKRGIQSNGAANYNTYVDISQKKREVLDWIASRFGGTVKARVNRQDSFNPGGLLYSWRIDGNVQCSVFLKMVVKYTIVKRDQVEMALQFIAERHNMSDEQKDNVVTLIKSAKRAL